MGTPSVEDKNQNVTQKRCEFQMELLIEHPVENHTPPVEGFL